VVLAVLGLLVALGVAGGYGLGVLVDAVRSVLPGAQPQLTADKVTPPEPIDLSGPADTCLPESLEVSLAAGATSVQVGDPMVFSMRVVNVGRAPCLVDGSDASRSVTITETSSDERVWSSGDCAEGERMLLLGPEDVSDGSVRWSSVRTVPGCKPGQPNVQPGEYEARLTLADVPGVQSDPVRFTVTPAPKAEPSEKPSGEPSSGPSATPSEEPSTGPSTDPSADAEPTEEATKDR
jgi:hypothetical protein